MKDVVTAAVAAGVPAGARSKDVAATVAAAPVAERDDHGAFGTLTGARTLACAPDDLARAVRDALARHLGLAEGAGSPGGTPEKDLELVAQGRIEEADLVRLYAQVSGLPLADEEEVRDLAPFPEVTLDFLSHHTCLPLLWDGSHVVLAVAEPYGVGRLSQA